MLLLISLFCGVLLGFGLGLAEMTKPSVVLSFLDITGQWDVRLMFVMMGGIGVHALFYHLVVKRRDIPIYGQKFCMPGKVKLDFRLIFGSLIFGVGWGMSGVCPGVTYINLGMLDIRIVYFIGVMFLGNFTYRVLNHYVFSRK
ncbi:MAG: YeeE/YedE family protein [Methylococcales bacterium]|jgi:uncharacterized protein|nr:YeeE/YedE family protein [Methylococcales bacterium]MBT7445906.1 YeeE/YedE family protein [Methylococcales bacterium]